MTRNELAKAWPDYTETHDISDLELARIAFGASDVNMASDIWSGENWWTDEVCRDFNVGGDHTPFSD